MAIFIVPAQNPCSLRNLPLAELVVTLDAWRVSVLRYLWLVLSTFYQRIAFFSHIVRLFC